MQMQRLLAMAKYQNANQYLTTEQNAKVSTYNENYEFYYGNHWMGIEPDEDRDEITINLVKTIVDKYTSMEVGKGVSFSFNEKTESIVYPFVEEVWQDSSKNTLLYNIAEGKAVAGDAYILIQYVPKMINGLPNDDFNDPFGEFSHLKGRIKLMYVPANICFPTYKAGTNGDYEDMESCTIVYQQDVTDDASSTKLLDSLFGNFGREVFLNGKRKIYVRHVYTKDTISYYIDNKLINEIPNELGFIPIVHYRNVDTANSYFGTSDIEDIKRLNQIYNINMSDIASIIDYNAQPLMAIFGARVGILEAGDTKIISNLPKDAKIELIEMLASLDAPQKQAHDLYDKILAIANMPAIAMGQEPPTNTSGVAMEIAFLPLLNLILKKQTFNTRALTTTNKMILAIAIKYGLLKLLGVEVQGKDGKTSKVTEEDIRLTLKNIWISFPSFLPRNLMDEINLLDKEISLAIESRRGAMERLGKEEIEEKIVEIDKDRKDNPTAAGVKPIIVSGNSVVIHPDNGDFIYDGVEHSAEVSAKALKDNPAPTASPNSPAMGGKEADVSGVGENKDGVKITAASGYANRAE